MNHFCKLIRSERQRLGPNFIKKKKWIQCTHVTKKMVIIPEIRMKLVLYLRNSKEKAAATIRITKDHLTCF